MAVERGTKPWTAPRWSGNEMDERSRQGRVVRCGGDGAAAWAYGLNDLHGIAVEGLLSRHAARMWEAECRGLQAMVVRHVGAWAFCTRMLGLMRLTLHAVSTAGLHRFHVAQYPCPMILVYVGCRDCPKVYYDNVPPGMLPGIVATRQWPQKAMG